MTTVLPPLLEALVGNRGSDLLLSVGTPPVVRIDGQLRRLETAPCTPELVRACAGELLDADQQRRLEAERQLDFSFSWNGRARFRAHFFFQRDDLSLAVRHIPARIPTPEELGVPPAVVALASRPQGLVIVTGPTGAGKSTTMAALVDFVNRTRPCHIVTIEDPVEYVHQHRLAVVDQREVGQDAPSFPAALRAVLREDPDVVLVGEMRDLESVAATLTVAETGHLVFATLHTNDAAGAVDRVVDVFPAAQQQQIRTQLAACLAGVVFQQLLPRAGGGRVAAFEILLANTAVRTLIREAKTNQLVNVIASGVGEGMQTMAASVEALVNAGLVAAR